MEWRDIAEDSGKVSHYLQEKRKEKGEKKRGGKKEIYIRNRPITKYIIHLVYS